jgi:hypothetical protein
MNAQLCCSSYHSACTSVDVCFPCWKVFGVRAGQFFFRLESGPQYLPWLIVTRALPGGPLLLCAGVIYLQTDVSCVCLCIGMPPGVPEYLFALGVLSVSSIAQGWIVPSNTCYDGRRPLHCEMPVCVCVASQSLGML